MGKVNYRIEGLKALRRKMSISAIQIKESVQRYRDGESIKSIAGSMGLNESTVAKHIQREMEKIRLQRPVANKHEIVRRR